jgi:hypothetical protein
MEKSNKFVSFGASAFPSISAEEDDSYFDPALCSGSYSAYYSSPSMLSPSGMAMPSEKIGYVRSGKGRVFLVCPGCGRRYLLKEENITTPIFDMSCECGTTLEIKEEE